jgi:hypothetical protein
MNAMRGWLPLLLIACSDDPPTDGPSDTTSDDDRTDRAVDASGEPHVSDDDAPMDDAGTTARPIDAGRDGTTPTNGTGGAPAGGAPAGGAPASGDTSSGGTTAGQGGSAPASGGSAGALPPGAAGASPNSVICGSGEYDTDLTDDILTCAPWSVCGPGTHMDEIGTRTADRLCVACPEGTYSTEDNEFSCSVMHRCTLGEQVLVEGSASNDRTCEDADLFPTYHTSGDGSTRALVVTDAGAYVLGEDYATGLDLWNGYVLHYSLSGDRVSTFTPGGALWDMTHLGDDLFVTSVNHDTLARAGEPIYNPGILSKFSADGTLLWQRDLREVDNDHFSYVRTASHAGGVYTAARVDERNCVSVGGGYECDDIDTAPSPSFVLHVHDTNGDRGLSTTLAPSAEAISVTAISVASDGHLYVAIQLGPYGQDSAVLEVDETAVLVAEHPLMVLGEESVIALSPDTSGGVYAFTRSHEPGSEDRRALHRFAAGGEESFSQELVFEERIENFTVNNEGLLFVGSAAEGPVLLRAYTSGTVMTRDVLAPFATASQYSGIVETADGSVFVSGVARGLFVVKWPE